MAEEFDLTRMISEVEGDLGLPGGSIRPFFEAEQHWVFVLKTTSIVETVLKSALFARIRPASEPWQSLASFMVDDNRETALRDHIFRIPLRGDIGAIALAKGYNLLVKEEENFINELTSIRNRYAHSILNHSKTAMEMIRSAVISNRFRLASEISDLVTRSRGCKRIFLASAKSSLAC